MTSPTSSEATLLLDDGEHQCRAFEHPQAAQVGDLVREPLLGFETREVERDDSGPPCFVSDGTSLGHFVRGRVEAREGPLIRVGRFGIEPDIPLPGDIDIGETVRFYCSRLDYMG